MSNNEAPHANDGGAPRGDSQAAAQADASAAIREFLIAKTYTTRPAFEASMLSHRLIALLSRLMAQAWDEARPQALRTGLARGGRTASR